MNTKEIQLSNEVTPVLGNLGELSSGPKDSLEGALAMDQVINEKMIKDGIIEQVMSPVYHDFVIATIAHEEKMSNEEMLALAEDPDKIWNYIQPGADYAYMVIGETNDVNTESGRVINFKPIVKNMAASVLLLSTLVFYSCERTDIPKKDNEGVVVVDKTWAKEIEGGKVYSMIVGPNGYELGDAVSTLVKPDNYQLKTISYTPVINKNSLKAFFSNIESKFLGQSPCTLTLTFMYQKPGESTFTRIASTIVSSGKLPEGIIGVDINSLSDSFSLKGLPDSNGGTIQFDSFLFPKDTKFQVRGNLGLGISPNYTSLGTYSYNQDLGL